MVDPCRIVKVVKAAATTTQPQPPFSDGIVCRQVMAEPPYDVYNIYISLKRRRISRYNKLYVAKKT